MRLTLGFIARHMRYRAELHVPLLVEGRYERVLLGGASVGASGELDAKTVYVVDELPDDVASIPSGRAFIVVCPDAAEPAEPASPAAPAPAPEPAGTAALEPAAPAASAPAAAPALPANVEVLVVRERCTLAEVFNEVALLFERYARWELELSRFASMPDGLQRACDFLYEALGNPVYCVDDGFKVLAIRGSQDAYETGYVWKHLVDDGYMPWNVIDELVSKNEISIMEESRPAVLVSVSSLNTPFVNLAIRDKGKRVGYFFVVGLTSRPDVDDVAVINELAPTITSIFLGSADIALLRDQRYEGFLRDVTLGELVDRDIIRPRATLLGLDPDAHYLVCLFDTAGKHELSRAEVQHYLADSASCWSFAIDGSIVALCKLRAVRAKGDVPNVSSTDETFGTSPLARTAKRMRTIARRTHCRVGISDRFAGIADLPAHYLQAKLALEYAAADSAADADVAVFAQHYFQALAGVVAERPFRANAFVNRDALVLASYDSAHGTDYSATLLAYALNDRNSVRTAAAMHIHRSTLTYRLSKIEEICDIDLAEHDRLLATAFSIFLLRGISA